MKIGVDTGCLGVKDERLKVGVYQLTFNLLRELGEIDCQNEYLLFSFRPISPLILKRFGPRMKNIVARPRRGWRYFGLPLAVWRNQVDFFLGPSQVLPYFCPQPSLVIVHDLAFERFPDCYPHSGRRLRRLTKEAVKKATKIVAVSQATKRGLEELYKVPRKKIEVVYEGINPIFKPTRAKSSGRPYFLFVGDLKRIKNVTFLLRAFRRFLDETGRHFQLILAGGDFWLDPEIPKAINRLKLSKNIRRLGFVPGKNLPALYSGAIAFVSPALYEGFGLTLLEAMACGCPAIAGNTGAQPEVVAQAGILVNPTDENQLVAAMKKITADRRLRQKLAATGLARARQFSWSKFAKEILAQIQTI